MLNNTIPTDLIPPADAAEMIGVAPHTLACWRSKRQGPPYYKPSGRRILYSRREIEQYIGKSRVELSV